LGDNTVSSYDSRKFGDLPQQAIVGRLLAVYWPVSPRFGFGVR
jgi:type IV secretory pathway protease TraF